MVLPLSPILLRACYAMSGTDTRYGAILLRTYYAMSGTDIAPARLCYAMPGTDMDRTMNHMHHVTHTKVSLSGTNCAVLARCAARRNQIHSSHLWHKVYRATELLQLISRHVQPAGSERSLRPFSLFLTGFPAHVSPVFLFSCLEPPSNTVSLNLAPVFVFLTPFLSSRHTLFLTRFPPKA
eukprot:1103091-Rhodomonas_salina.1